MDTPTAEQVLSLLDPIVVNPLDDVDLLERLTALRTLMAGQAPSIILKQVVQRDPADVERIQALTIDNEALTARLTEAVRLSNAPVPDDKGFYSLEDFEAALQRKRGRTYAWKVDYCIASQNTPNCKVARNEDVQKWQKTLSVPGWAYEQIDRLVFPVRKGTDGPPWTQEEHNYLRDLYLEDDTRTNAMLADACTLRFGRQITENAIRGDVDRQRKKGILPKKRTKKEKK